MNALKDHSVPSAIAERLEKEAWKYWNGFYKANKDKFFKDRHWFASEFPLLLTAETVLEVGCGTGNTAFPLMEINDKVEIFACDFSPEAIDIVKAHHLYSSKRIKAFVADISRDKLTQWVSPQTVDICTCIFCFSALSPLAMHHALNNIVHVMKPGGRVLLRDYAAGDLAQRRLEANGKQQQLGQFYFARSDGTKAYYFSEDELKKLFEHHGFECEELRTLNKMPTNHKTGVTMTRCFVQGVFRFVALKTSVTVQTTEKLDLGGKLTDGVTTTMPFLSSSLVLRIPSSLTQEQKLASDKMVSFIYRHSYLFCGQRVFHLGCEAGAMAAFAAIGWARLVIAIDTKPDPIEALRCNIIKNRHLILCERLLLQVISSTQRASELKRVYGGANIILMEIVNEINLEYFQYAANLLSGSKESHILAVVLERLLQLVAARAAPYGLTASPAASRQMLQTCSSEIIGEGYTFVAFRRVS